MAHMIDMTNNRANIAYVGQVPWHGLGQQLTKEASIETWLTEAGLDWTAERARIMFQTKEGEIVHGNSNIIYRSDTKKEIGVVTDRYKIVQPKEVLEFYRDMVATQGWHIDVAGALDGGKRVWALAKTDAEFSVAGTMDKVETYLLLATSFDGTMATIGKFSSLRVVCQNTLTMSLNDSLAKVSVPHSANFNPQQMKEALGIYSAATEQFAQKANMLANRRVSDKEAMTFIKNIMAGEDTPVDDVSTRTANVIKSIFDKFKGDGYGSNMSSAEGTLWGVVNAITEYNAHDAGHNANNRLRNNWFGTNDKTNMEALDKAVELV